MLALIACGLLAFARVAHAQSAPSYDDWIKVALDASDQHDWTRAYDAFAHANESQPNARTERGMGVASYRMGRYAQAWLHLHAALIAPQKPLSVALRTGVSRLLVDIDRLIGFCELELTPRDAHWTLDDEAPLLDDTGRAVVTTGNHVVRATAPGHEPASMHVTIEANVIAKVSLALDESEPIATQPSLNAERDMPVSTLPVTQVAPTSTPQASAANHAAFTRATAPRTRSRTWTWIAAASVPVFVVGAALAWNHANAIGDGLARECRARLCSSDQKSQLIRDSSLASYEALANVGIGLAIGAAVTAGTLFFLEDSSAREPAVSVRGTSVRWRF